VHTCDTALCTFSLYGGSYCSGNAIVLSLLRIVCVIIPFCKIGLLVLHPRSYTISILLSCCRGRGFFIYVPFNRFKATPVEYEIQTPGDKIYLDVKESLDVSFEALR